MQSDSAGSGFFGHGLIVLVISIAILAISFLLATGILSSAKEDVPVDVKSKNDADSPDQLLDPPAFPPTDSGGKSDRTRRKPPGGDPQEKDIYKVRRERKQ